MPDSTPARAGILQRVGSWLARSAPGPTLPAVPEQKALPPGDLSSTGVTFTGRTTARMLFLDPNAPDLDAERLSRAAAFITAAYCYVAMLWRASRFAEPALMVVQETEDGEKWLPKHRLAGFLMQPRPDIIMKELLVRSTFYRDLTGACVWDLERDIQGTGLLMATPYAATEFKVEALGNLIYGRYDVRTSQGWRQRDRVNLIHFRDVNPASWYTPAARVDVALGQLDLGHTVNRITRHFLQKAMFPGGIISPDKDWHPGEDEWEEWKEALDAWHGGPSRAGVPLALKGGTTFSRTASGMADLLPVAVLDRVEATIAAVFGVPPVILGFLVGLQNSPWSQMEEARRMGYEDTIEPMWRDFEQVAGMTLLAPEERDQGLMLRFDTRKVRALKDDEEQKARISTQNMGIWKIGERRLFTGQELLGDERDDLFEVELAAAAAPPPPPAVGDTPPPKAPAAGKDSRDLVWLLFDLESKASERGWEPVIHGHLQNVRADVVKAARATLEPATKDEAGDARHRFQLELQGIIQDSTPALVAKTYPLLVQTGGKAVRRLASRVGLTFQHLEPGLLKYAQEEAGFLAHVMGEETGRAVAAAVQAGLAKGETIAALVKRLEDLPAFDTPRAKLVARTETTRAWNGSQRRSLSEYSRASGRVVQKSWLSSRDDRVREEHAALDDGTSIPVDATFANGLSEPGEPNCRCTLVYELAESADAPAQVIEEGPDE